jgi:predicted ATPase
VSVTPPSAPAGIESWEVLDLLTALVQKSLVVYEENEQGQGRYRLLETVRQYARKEWPCLKT